MARTFNSWSSAAAYLHELILGIRPLAGQNIAIEQVPRGRRINALGGAGGGDGNGYNGCFKVIDTSGENEARVSVVDGAGTVFSDDDSKCGVAYINDMACTRPETTELTITGNCHIYAEANINGKVTFKQSPGLPDFNEQNIGRIIIARVQYHPGEGSGSAPSVTVYQEHYGALYMQIYGKCDE